MLAALIKKELLALVRDMHGLAVLFLMPMVFIVLMSLTLKDIYRPPLAELTYAVDARDTATPAKWLLQIWQRSHGAPQPLGADWQERLRSGSLKYVIVLEPGLSEELESAALSTKAHIRLLAEPGIDANLFNALRAELIGASGELKARLALAVPGTASPAPDASIQAMVQAERFSTAGPRPTSVQQNVPAWLVFGMFFVVASLSSLFVQERGSGALGRLQSLGVSRTMLLASKALPYLGVNALQALLPVRAERLRRTVAALPDLQQPLGGRCRVARIYRVGEFGERRAVDVLQRERHQHDEDHRHQEQHGEAVHVAHEGEQFLLDERGQHEVRSVFQSRNERCVRAMKSCSRSCRPNSAWRTAMPEASSAASTGPGPLPGFR